MKNLLNVKQLQSLLGVGKDWVYERVRSGQLPFYKIGRGLRFKESEIESFLEQSNKSKNRDKFQEVKKGGQNER